MLDDFGNELENTESKIDSTMKKMAKVLHMNNGIKYIILFRMAFFHTSILFIIFFFLASFSFRQTTVDCHRNTFSYFIHCDTSFHYPVIWVDHHNYICVIQMNAF